MDCPHCQFSLKNLKLMQENHTEFYTAAGRKKLWIAEVDEVSKTIRLERSTGKITWPLAYQKIKDVHDKIHQGQLALDAREIGQLIPLWGNYVTGLLQHFGCK